MRTENRWLLIGLGPALLLLALTLAQASRAASPEPDCAHCIPKRVQPIARCLPPETPGEHALITLRQAERALAQRHFAQLEWLLAADSNTTESSIAPDVSVRRWVLLGKGALGRRELRRAQAFFEKAVAEWSSQRTLDWIRSLPSGQASQEALRVASDAGAEATFQLAELQFGRLLACNSPLAMVPDLTDEWNAPPTPDSVSNNAQRTGCQLETVAAMAADSSAMREWYWVTQPELIRLAREYAKTLLVAPVASPRWRIQTEARIGELWARFRTVVKQFFEISCTATYREHHSPVECRSEGERETDSVKRLARGNFEGCLYHSIKFRVDSAATRACEKWLSRHYQSEFVSYDELVPGAGWRRGAFGIVGSEPATLHNDRNTANARP